MSADGGRARPALVLAGLLWAGTVVALAQGAAPPLALAALLSAAAWLAGWTAAAWGGGRWVWRALAGHRPRDLDDVVPALLLGALPLAAAAALLSAAGRLTPPFVLVVLAVFVALGAPSLVRGVRGALPLPALPAAARLPLAIAVPALVLVALATPTDAAFYDQLHYQLALPWHALRAGHLVVWPRHGASYFPATTNLLFVYGLAALGPWAAQVIHGWFGLLGILAAMRLARRLGPPGSASWTLALLATTPAVMWLLTLAGVDLVLAAALAASFLVLHRATVDDDSPGGTATRNAAGAASRGAGTWVIVGLLLGLAGGSKYVAGLTVGLPAGVALLLARGTARDRAVRCAAAALGAAAAAGPWLLRNALLTGNPVYPLFSGTLKGAGVALFRDPARILSLGLLRPEDGPVGAAYLLLLPVAAWACLRAPAGGRVLLAAIAAALLGWSLCVPLAGRYLVPALYLLAAPAGAGVAALLARTTSAAVRRTAGGALGVVLLGGALAGIDAQQVARIGVVLGAEPADAVQRRWSSYWPAVAVVNERLPAGAKVLLAGESRSLYLERDVVVEEPFGTPLLVELSEREASAPAMADALRAQGITHVLFNAAEAERIARTLSRDGYFAPRSPAARERLGTFWNTCLAPVWSEGPLQVRALAGCR